MVDKIKTIQAREILASGGMPTIETTVELENGIRQKASVPFGVSAGIHEACTLIDNDAKRYGGHGMLQACRNVNEVIAKKLRGLSVTSQRKIDELMITLDGTPNKKKLGGNSILSVSLAIARAGAAAVHKPLYQYLRDSYRLPYTGWKLPKPMMVVIEGGKHADNSTDFQEYLMSVAGAPTVREAVRWGEETYQALAQILKEKSLNANIGNEGAFAPTGIETNELPLKLIMAAIARAGYTAGKDIFLSLDPAASEFYNSKEKKYVLKREGVALSSDQLIGLYQEWLTKYPLLSLEDGLAEDDWDGWSSLFRQLHDRVRIVGDDLTVTDAKRVQQAIKAKAINAVLIKLNQIGTLTETIKTVELGKKHGFWQIISHRGGGETNDTFMVDLAVAVNAEYIKVGPARGERVAKYNRLVAIEEELQGESGNKTR